LAEYLAVFAGYLLVRTLAAVRLSRGFVRMLPFGSLQLVRVGAIWSAMSEAFFAGNIAFQTTPKGRQSSNDDRARVAVPFGLWLMLASVFGLYGWLLFRLQRSGGDFGGAGLGGALVAAGWLTLLAVIVGSALIRVRAEQYGHDRRDSYRMPLQLPCRVEADGFRSVGIVEEASFSGATVRLAGDPASIPDVLCVHMARDRVTISLPLRVVRRGEPDAKAPGAAVVHARFDRLSFDERVKLTLMMFHGSQSPYERRRGRSDARRVPVPRPS
jgi:hypothetical protein